MSGSIYKNRRSGKVAHCHKISYIGKVVHAILDKALEEIPVYVYKPYQEFPTPIRMSTIIETTYKSKP